MVLTVLARHSWVTKVLEGAHTVLVVVMRVLPLLDWLKKISIESWELGEWTSIDEQAIGFQGQHADKLRINCKAEGDGFQAKLILACSLLSLLIVS